MSLARVKDKFQVTIPAVIRKKLGIKVGDVLEALAQGDKILFRPQATVERSKAEAMDRFFTVLDEVGEKNKSFSDEEVMEDVLKAIQDVRREKYAQRRR